MPTCPDCHGDRETHGLGCRPAGCKLVTMPCRTCSGTGWINPLTMEWRTVGARLREIRMGHRLSLREASKRLGIRASDYSDAEHGRVDPGPLIPLVTALPNAEA